MDIKEVRALVSQKKYNEAAEKLRRMQASEEENSEFWFLRGIVLLKIKNYDLAQECFARALEIEKKPEFYRTMGIAHLEIFELKDAVEDFKNALGLDEKDVTSHFFLSIAYMFMDDGRAEEHMANAKKLDSKKTKALLKNFYTLFLKDDPTVSDAQKRNIEKKIDSI